MNTSLYSKQHKHLVAVDCVIFAYLNEELNVLLFKRELPPAIGELSLVGGWIEENESAEDAAKRVLKKITGLQDIFMEQVSLFSAVDRDPGGHVMSVVFSALIDIQKHNPDLVKKYGAKWWPLPMQPSLIFDHNEMLQMALTQIQEKASMNLIGKELLPEEFSLTQLRILYSKIFQREFDQGNFRKKILSLNLLEKLDKKDSSGSKKGATLYKVKEDVSIMLNERIIKV